MLGIILAFTLGCCASFAYHKIDKKLRSKYESVRLIAIITKKEK
jgi:hypothetical protein